MNSNKRQDNKQQVTFLHQLFCLIFNILQENNITALKKKKNRGISFEFSITEKQNCLSFFAW